MAEAQAKRAMVIGLDSAEPSLVERWRDELPTLAATVLELLGLDVPADMRGVSLVPKLAA